MSDGGDKIINASCRVTDTPATNAHITPLAAAAAVAVAAVNRPASGHDTAVTKLSGYARTFTEAEAMILLGC